MKVQLMGAARTVTGSCYIIETGQTRFAVDCGMHQGNAQIEKRNFDSALYHAAKLDFILLTHAHIDHSGLVPRMVKAGFTGPVFCTEPTRDLLEIMLLDSAHIQEMEAEWANHKQARRGLPMVEALYTEEDAIASTKLLRPVQYDAPFAPAPGVSACYRDAGHILGSAFLELTTQESGNAVRMIFSGDLGRSDALIMRDPSVPTLEADYLFLESTYGDRNHKDRGNSRDELAEAIRYSYGKGGKVIIPAFAVERTQEILYALFLLGRENKIPQDIPVYLDSPLAIKATEIFNRHSAVFDQDAKDLIAAGHNPLSLPNLIYTPEVSQSQAINTQRGPAIIISASGMCNAGRIKHHLRHNLWRPEASVVFAGFQAVGTPGRKIVDGAKRITLLGEEISVAAKIFTIGGFSGHAGQSQILEWVEHFQHRDMKVILVHGEEKAQTVLADLLRQRFNLAVTMPDYLDTLELIPGKAPSTQKDVQAAAAKKINWEFLLANTENRLAQLRTAVPRAEKLSWAEQAELQENILDIGKRIEQLASML